MRNFSMNWLDLLLIRSLRRGIQARKWCLAGELSLCVSAPRTYVGGPMTRLFLLLLLSGLLTQQPACAEKILFAEDFGHGIANGWQNVAFFKAPTDYQAHREGTNCFVRGIANKTCSALSMKLNLPPPAKLILRWRWRIAGVNTNGSERELNKFDHAARVFIAFDTFIGPPRSINYLWGNVEPAGTVLEHPKSGRAQLFVVESGDAKAGRWVAEERDVTADWNRVFPGRAMPRVVGLGVMTDADSLGKELTGDYTDIQLIAE
jgi:hypothetical protein